MIKKQHMRKKTLAGLLKPRLTPFNLIICFLGLAALIILAVVLIQSLSREKAGTINPNQIKIQKGEKIVIVNENGLIEYRSPSGVFYDVWDSERITIFFTTMREKAREYLANPQPQLCQEGYQVTLYIDGKEVTICISDDDEVLDEVFDEFPDEEGNGSLSDIFDDFYDDDEGEPGTSSPTPTPTPLIVSAEEGEDVSSGDGGWDDQAVVDCSLFEFQVTGRTVISNTLCIPELEEEE